jgi:hypothetical protein
MVSCERVGEHFASQINILLSAGSVCTFREEAYRKLPWFEEWVSRTLWEEEVVNGDGTGINIGGKRVCV